MADWREQILTSFVPNRRRLTLVSDPDGLFSEEILARDLQTKGFTLIFYNDAIAFRYLFERDYRSPWEEGVPLNLVLILQGDTVDVDSLPFDIQSKGEKVAFGLSQLFPHLSRPVLEHVDRAILDRLCGIVVGNNKERLGENATKDYILRCGCHITADTVIDETALLRLLIRLHYNGTHLPGILAERVVESFKKAHRFLDWPLSEIISDSDAFFSFLQERWPLFLAQEMECSGREEVREPQLAYSGPGMLPFGHDDIRIYVDNLFVEGYLKPVCCNGESVPVTTWYGCGIEAGAGTDDVKRSKLLVRLSDTIPDEDCRYSEWIAYAKRWAELLALVYKGPSMKDLPEELSVQIDKAFGRWMQKHYKTLINEPPNTPAMLHHVPRKLARELEREHANKVALIVVDGLSLDQWLTIRGALRQQDDAYRMDESACFAWVPTLTSVSRQTAFSGKIPSGFPSTINTTNSEEKLWRQFWEEHGLKRRQIAYKRGLGDGNAVDMLDEVLHPEHTKALGLVVDKVDKIMHGMQLGSSGMYNQIKQWAETGFMTTLLQHLLDRGFQIWLTSDHGNIECRGIGRPNEGSIAETKGERVRIYPSDTLRSTVAQSYPNSLAWDPVGLPENYHPLLLSNREAFTPEGTTLVGHGGLSIQEVIVPLVKIERR